VNGELTYQLRLLIEAAKKAKVALAEAGVAAAIAVHLESVTTSAERALHEALERHMKEEQLRVAIREANRQRRSA
jgi:hypothetical protein